MWNFSDFPASSVNISKTVADTAKVTIIILYYFLFYFIIIIILLLLLLLSLFALELTIATRNPHDLYGILFHLSTECVGVKWETVWLYKGSE